MHNLTYIGPNPAAVGIVPLPEGWPAANHTEEVTSVFVEKCQSGAYRAWCPEDGDVACYDERTASQTQQEAISASETVDPQDSALDED